MKNLKGQISRKEGIFKKNFVVVLIMGEATVGNGRKQDCGVMACLSHLPEQLWPAHLSETVCVKFPRLGSKEGMCLEIVMCCVFYYSGF